MSDGDQFANEFDEEAGPPPKGAKGGAGGIKQHKRWTLPPMVYRDGATIPQRKFLYGYAYARGYVSAIIGDGGVGKSIDLIAECLVLASGKDLLGVAPYERVRVGYWSGDEPYVELERRFHAVCEYHGLDLKTLIDQGWLYLDTSDKQPLHIASTGRYGRVIINQDAVADVDAFIRECEIGFLCFDPLKSLHRVAENSNTDMDAVADVFKGIAERTDAAIALAHHIRKPVAGQNEATAADARGASALINKVRLSRVFNVMTPQLAINARILEDQRSSYFRVDSGKRNIAPAEKATWYKIIPVTCANGQDTPTVVPWTYPNVFDQVTIDHVTRIRTIAAEGAYRKDPRSKEGPWIGEAVADMLDLDLNDETDRKQLNKILKTWFNNGVLATEERPDDQRKKRKFVVPGPSWNDADAGSATIIPFPTASPITSAEQDAFGPSDKGTSAAPTTAAMPFMLTAAHKRELRALGYTDEEIREMTPQKGHDILAQRRLSERHCKLADVLTAWFATIGVAQPRTIEQVIAAANGGDDDAQRKLRLALMAVAPKDNRADGIDSTRLEKWLRSISGTEVEHLTLRSRGLDENKVLQWALELRVEPDKGSPSL